MKVIRIKTDLIASDGIEYEIDSQIFPGDAEKALGDRLWLPQLEEAMRLYLQDELDAAIQCAEQSGEPSTILEDTMAGIRVLTDSNYVYQNLITDQPILVANINDYNGAGDEATCVAAVIDVDPHDIYFAMFNLIQQTKAKNDDLELIKLADRFGGLFKRKEGK